MKLNKLSVNSNNFILFKLVRMELCIKRCVEWKWSGTRKRIWWQKWLRCKKKAQYKWVLFIRNGKRKWKETFKEIRTLNVRRTRKMISKQSQKPNEEQNIWYKQTVSGFFAFYSPISHVESTIALEYTAFEIFPLLIIRMNMNSENQVWFMQSEIISNKRFKRKLYTVVNHQNAWCNIIE